MWFLWCAWRYAGEDPYRLYNGPGAADPPPHPDRLTHLLYGFADFAAERDAELAGAKLGGRGG